MANKDYLSFLTNDQLFEAFDTVRNEYFKKNKKPTFKIFSSNLIDPFAMIFSEKMAGINEEDWILQEFQRQINKSISNAIGSFQEQILGFAPGYTWYSTIGDRKAHGMDIIKDDNTLFADIKNKFNTMNSNSQATLYNKFESVLKVYPDGVAYCVQIMAKNSFDTVWRFSKHYNPKIRMISGDKFYSMVFGEKDAFAKLVSILPAALDEYMKRSGHNLYKNQSKELIFKYLYSAETSKNNGSGKVNQNSESFYEVIARNTFKKYDGF